MTQWGEIGLEDDAILFADDDLVAVDKPAGVLSDASRDPKRDHLGAAVRRWATRTLGPDPDRQFLAAHRLDLATSGVVVFARNTAAATGLMQQFQDRNVTKRYRAVVVPLRDAGLRVGETVERRSYLRHRAGRTEEVRSGGKPSHSVFEILERSGPLALASAEPRSGRTHQLRVHLAGLGAPILGDDRYGSPAARPDACGRMWLHAVSLELDHPVTRQPLVLRSRFDFVLDDDRPLVRNQPR